MSMKEKIKQFISSTRAEREVLKFIANKTVGFVPGKDSVYYSGPYWDDDEIAAIFETILTGKWLTSGENVHKFEIAFSKRFGHRNSLMVNSGSSANLVLVAALKKKFGWQDEDEIIISVVGFPTTLNPILQNNLRPVFIDISLDDLNWDLEKLAASITPKTRAVFFSPVLGNPCDMDRLLEICQESGLQLIVDNCDSLGSKWRGEYLTSDAVASSCSFYPAHHITTAEGGMVSSNDPEIITIARSMAWWGRDCYCVGAANLLPCGTCGKRFDKWLEGYPGIVDHKYLFTNIGYNLKPLDLQGAIGLVQLEKFDDIHRLRRKHKQIIGGVLNRVEGVRVIEELPEAETGWFGTPVVCDNNDIKTRLVSHLESSKIQTRNYFAGNILIHPAYRHLDDYRDYPNANEVLDRVFFIGCTPAYTADMLQYIADVINGFIREELRE